MKAQATLPIALLSIAVVTSPANAQESCQPILTTQGIVQTRPYDPFSQTPLIDAVTIQFQGGECAAPTTIVPLVGLGPNQQARLGFQDQELAFGLSFDGIDLQLPPNSFIGADFGSNGPNIVLPSIATGSLAQQARLIIPESQIVRPGFYTLNVESNATARSGLLTFQPSTNAVRATPLYISTQVLAVLKLGVTGCDLAADSAAPPDRALGFELATSCALNLGDPAVGMVNGDARRARISAQTNVNFKVTMLSRNSGVLKLASGLDQNRQSEQVQYSATLEGAGQNAVFTCSLNNCGSSETIEPLLSPLGTDLFFQVRINDPNMGRKRAGIYSDTITLIIQPAS